MYVLDKVQSGGREESAANFPHSLIHDYCYYY